MPDGALTLTLPEPPSANRWWRNVRGRMVTSREAREYKAAVAARKWTGPGAIFAAPLRVSVRLLWFRSRKSGDLDKRIGVLLDALQGFAFDTDAQVVVLHAERYDDPRNPRVEVTVEPLGGA